ncbi:threonine dehydratase [Fodinibius roseus]|uniref:Threonine dehydratase n=1 Tax=Fodinibius roseus TaxID=1194090 RepID=A0A1M5BZM5_9BACT|nr:pyridoxal-phosphate dependent enzyme [Fodinibius roseus]SHF47939.1 threonine dehydratase [Fodinibius roseus]
MKKERNQSVPPMAIPSFSDIRHAYQNIGSYTHRTPVLSSEKVNDRAGGAVFFKCENFQKTGAFKYRGATHAVAELLPAGNPQGVATHSSGNHAQAVALAARVRNIPAHIVMPENAPRVKVNAVREYGADITFCEATQEARETTLEEVVQQTGADFIHPYDNPHIIMGQGTAALELLQEQPELDMMLVPIGGGGLISGSAIAASALSPETTIIGVEPEVANDACLSFNTGMLHPVQSTETVADGLRTSLSELTFRCIQQHVDDIITVNEQEILDAMRFVWERMKMIIEPSSAVPVAAVFNRIDIEQKRVGVIISGGNMDLDHLPWNDNANGTD